MKASARLRIPSLRRGGGGRLFLSASDDASIGSSASSSTTSSSARGSPHLSTRKTSQKKQGNSPTSRSKIPLPPRSSPHSTATSKKRRVRFAPNLEDDFVHTEDILDEEPQKQDIWYTRVELNEFKNEAKALAEILEQDEGTGCIAVESEFSSFRGLITRQRQMDRAESLAQCHLKISWQLDTNMGLNYFDQPANLLPHTQAACQQALQAGRQDEIDARFIFREEAQF